MMLIGRENEIQELLQAYDSDESRFVAVFGRRRIGKTYLVREIFNDNFAFTYSGIAKASTKEQLQRFYLTLKDYGYRNGSKPHNWIEAFHMLEQYLRELPTGKKVIFLDELPWMDGPKSSFMPAFENFWNGWASARKDVLFIVCGSATSWMVKKILNNRGGLHNRLNNHIHLQPFNLYECELYSKNIGLPMERADIMEAYMIFGGIPFYWSLLNKSLSLSQNIDALFFGKSPKLKNEFEELYSSLFNQPEAYIDIITALAKKKIGMTRDEIINNANLATSGLLTKYLEDLENCGFIHKYQALGNRTKNSVYQLIDNFTLFYFKFMDGRRNTDSNFWTKMQISPVLHNWRGLAFERVCLMHSEQIKKALGISGVITSEYSWRTAANKEHPGAQIDLLIDRSDKIINLCEIKYSSGPYTIDKTYMEALQNKTSLFRQLTKTRKGIALTMITSYDLVKNSHSINGVHSQLTADDLFVDA
ncbi:MAG: AAA family ATPase [Muribaculaceae bacterium]|nr:AAA family ATPase [Muribaculaceae bacterium]